MSTRIYLCVGTNRHRIISYLLPILSLSVSYLPFFFLTQYRFGSSFSSLLRVCGAETVAIAEISSMSQVCLFFLLFFLAHFLVLLTNHNQTLQDSQYGETNRMICVIPISSGDKFGRLKNLSLLSRVNEMDLISAILSGNLPSTSLIPPSGEHTHTQSQTYICAFV